MVIVAQLVEPRIVIPAVVGSSPIGHPRFAITKTRSSIYGIVTEGHRGPLAQLVEQLTLNQRVAGSSPARPTTIAPGRRCHPRGGEAKVAELVDALVLGASGVTRGSSNLPFRTNCFS